MREHYLKRYGRGIKMGERGWRRAIDRLKSAPPLELLSLMPIALTPKARRVGSIRTPDLQ